MARIIDGERRIIKMSVDDVLSEKNMKYLIVK